MVHVLSSRIMVRPVDPDRSREFYGQTLGLPVYREFGTGPERGTVYFLGGGHLELSRRVPERTDEGAIELWLQVEDVAAAHEQLSTAGATILRPPVREPWGLIEMWITDPDGHRIVLVEVPADHPLRYRP
ncbi:VOC family protein [Streptomyces clavuligerus]|uniref:Putative lactoylglutathione lyase n=1 Tax=Streptomyces clavuligerus TaxID=1901 RepID=B5H2P4_STRCL|nr:VOC family protein [Streptomyces clavuligerus]ANW21469.1 glyoxalase [Streptomyces clavuligerus]AXU16100.1 VOC family protein [Streptomyces clavuligerus]EDY52840.1 conserved hypothetical protein [Streptomyces clavuligerus]EFG05376.1 Putative lactoylglutathione lyase [Streptomyces clavuligerus]MBY6306239.1 VOC family protein [Streptomyces clavuligerus]